MEAAYRWSYCILKPRAMDESFGDEFLRAVMCEAFHHRSVVGDVRTQCAMAFTLIARFPDTRREIF